MFYVDVCLFFNLSNVSVYLIPFYLSDCSPFPLFGCLPMFSEIVLFTFGSIIYKSAPIFHGFWGLNTCKLQGILLS